ncbi:MAG: MOSC domain-containing protein [Nocardioidaceae bacterium]
MRGLVLAVCSSPAHTMSKASRRSITLVEGLGVAGDAHLGGLVQHRSRVRRDPSKPNLRQVHLMKAELHAELRSAGYDVGPGVMGENVTTLGIDLLGLPTGTRLQLGAHAVVSVTGLRNPCSQLDDLQEGLMAATLGRGENGAVVRKAGVMSVVVVGGTVRRDDEIHVVFPDGPHRSLDPV